MNTDHKSITVRIVPAVVALLTLSTLASLTAFAQTLVVRGAVTTPSSAARFASVTFVDKGDTTRKTSVLTDTAGRYAVNILTSATQVAAPPSEFKLEQNYPNPFSTSTEISYQINKQADVTVTVYDILGREIRRFAAGDQGAGVHGVLWDGKNSAGELVSRGIYFYQLRVQNETRVKKMLYGFGGNTMITAFASVLAPQQAEAGNGAHRAFLAGSYTVQIANTDSTFPPVIAQQFDNVAVQNNATLDFSVSTNGTFPDPTAAIIYADNPQQVIRGFGAANILPWRPDMTSDQVQKAFGSGPGQLGFSILRLRVPPNDTTTDPFKNQVPTAKLAMSLGAIVFATPWTPPPAMKSNNNTIGGTLNVSAYANYAAYLKSFAGYMAANGAPLYAISLQNEPDATVTYESCSWNGTQFLNFMKNNAASIGTRVIMPESQNFVHALSDPTLNDSVAASNTAIIAGHLYGGGLAAYPLATSKGKEFWMTEYLDLDTTWAGTGGTVATGVLSTGKQISDCMKVGMNAYIWWYIVRYYGPIDESGVVTKRGYVMSQFARFVRPGSFRLSSTDNSIRSRVDVTAYGSGSKLVLVAVNRNSSATTQTFTLWNGTVGGFTPYVTSKSKNCEQQSTISFKNGVFNYTLEPLSVTTFVLN
jgi:glucuronoarabinoxylan endo-1,4-beta-xylanase